MQEVMRDEFKVSDNIPDVPRTAPTSDCVLEYLALGIYLFKLTNIV
jgi:hypothetical protein